MIPIHLSIAGFLSYRDRVDIDFTRFDLACISGANGAGKSALLDAITFALFGQARNRGEALINTSKGVSAAQVTLTFAYEANTYRVQRTNPRDKATILEFHIQTGPDKWKALTERTLRETENRIRETLRLDYETFVNASFFLQGKADQFTQQKPADRKRILSSVLGLEIWEEYRARAALRRKTVEEQMGVLQGRLHEINAELGEEEQRKTHLKELQAQLKTLSETRAAQEAIVEDLRARAASVEQQRALVATLAAQLERGRAQLAENRTRLEERRSEQLGNSDLLGRAKQIEADYKHWQSLREEVARLDALASQFHDQERKRAEPLRQIETERAALDTELKTLLAEQGNLKALAAQKAGLESEFKLLQAAVLQVERSLAKRAELEEALKGQRAQETSAKSENPMLQEEMRVLDNKIKQMEAAKGKASCPTCGQPLTEEHRTSVIADLTKEGKKMGDRWRANRRAIEDAAKRIAELESTLKELDELEVDLHAKSVKAGQLRSRIDELTQLELAWNQQRAPRLAQVEALLNDGSYALEARRVLAELDAELKKTGYDPARHETARQDEIAARAAEGDMRALEQAQAAAKPLGREIAELEKQVATQEKDLAAQEATYKQAADSLSPQEAGLPNVDTAERAMLATQERENQLRQAVGAAQQEVAVLDTLRVRKAEFEVQREQLAHQVSQFQALERAFGKDGVPAMLIEQALPQIETKANQILDQLSAGTMSIRFVTQQRYKDSRRDDLRETLEIQISDSAGLRDYEMFSGGEAFRINFAIRLALSEVLAQRAGARLQTLVIDEGFGSQDEAGRQRLVEVIGQVRQDFSKILVITHIDALKDAFPNRIEVEKGPQGSTVRVI